MNVRITRGSAVPALIALTLAAGVTGPAAHAASTEELAVSSTSRNTDHEIAVAPHDESDHDHSMDDVTDQADLSSMSSLAAAPSYGKPKNNPHPAANTRAPKATKRTQFVDAEIARLTGERQCGVGGYRSYQRSTSNHNTGNALDCLISSKYGVKPTASQREQGWKLARWLKTYANRLDVRYVIWDKKIWSVARKDEGWRKYTAAGGVTGGHLDHVHVSIQNPGNRD